MYRPRSLGEELMAISKRYSFKSKFLFYIWWFFGVIYLAIYRDLQFPRLIAIALLLPVLFSAFALALFNIYRVIYWIIHLRKS